MITKECSPNVPAIKSINPSLKCWLSSVLFVGILDNFEETSMIIFENELQFQLCCLIVIFH